MFSYFVNWRSLPKDLGYKDALNEFHEMLTAEPRTGATVMSMVHFPLPENGICLASMFDKETSRQERERLFTILLVESQ